MKKQFLTIGILLMLLVVGLSGCVGRLTDDFNGEYEADESTILRVSNINGPITINSWTGNTVTLDAVKSSYISKEELDNIDIEVNESGNVIDIETKNLLEGTTNVVTDMVIKVPNYVNIDTVSASNGDVHISGTKGNVSAHSSNGDVSVENVDGYISATNSNGFIEIKETTGIKNLHSSNGDIYAEFFDFKENISISTSNGDIILYVNPSLNANIEMTTSNGRISTNDLSLDLTISEEDNMVGTLGEGGYKIDIHNSNGDIKLYKLEV